jgi:hypothetical protein
MSQPEEKDSSLMIIFTEAERNLDLQFRSIDSLDTKVSLIIGFSGLILANLMLKRAALGCYAIHYLTIVCVLLSAVLALAAFFPRRFRADPSPQSLMKKYLEKTADETRRRVLANLARSFKMNQSIIRIKVRLMESSFVSLLAGLVFLSINLLLYRR